MEVANHLPKKENSYWLSDTRNKYTGWKTEIKMLGNNFYKNK